MLQGCSEEEGEEGEKGKGLISISCPLSLNDAMDGPFQ